jgi:hypothetical protein
MALPPAMYLYYLARGQGHTRARYAHLHHLALKEPHHFVLHPASEHTTGFATK